VTKTEGTDERVGSYRVVRRLATGGTSDLFLAKAEGPLGFERTVVLKVLLSQFQEDDGIARMFAREASAYARLAHPAIVRLLDFFAIPSPPPSTASPSDGRAGQLVMVLEQVDGLSLIRLKSMLKAAGKELDDRAAFYVASRVFEALAAAHSTLDDAGAPAPVIHRDVNPSNVLIPWDGEVKLADFGVAKVEHNRLAGMSKGTFGYMAPEQVTGDNVTPRADVYAGAIILWELLTKRKAFQRGALPEVEALRAMAEPRLPSIDVLRPDVDKGVRDALKRALEPRAERRVITAEEMAAVLGSVVPPDEGRERLVAALEIVRKDSRAAAVADKPTPPLRLSATQKAVMQIGIAPPPPPVPKFAGAASVPRMQATKSESAGAPKSPKAPSRAGLPAVTPPKPKTPSAAQCLGATAADTTRDVSASVPPEPATVSIFDSLVQPPSPVKSADELAQTEKRSPYAPPKLYDAIDEVLKGLPSSMPPSVLQHASKPPPAFALRPPAPETASPAPPAHKTGEIPPAPPPLQAIAPSPADAGVSPKVHVSPPTPKMMAAAPPVSSEPPLPILFSPPPPPPAGDSPKFASTALMGPYRPRPASVGDVPAQPPPAPAAPAVAVASPAPAQPAPVPAAPPVLSPQPSPAPFPSMASAQDSGAQVVPPRRSGAGIAVAIGLVVVIGGGIAGTIGYVRYQHKHVAATAEPPTASAATTPPRGSAGPLASAEPPASSAPTASASASASAAPSPSAEPSRRVAADMGVITTKGTVPHRRIFVDDKTVGQTPQSVTVKCGKRVVRLGSAGKRQTIDVPCGGEIAVSDKF
jgi:serine/threonine protein kinase